MCFFIYFLSFNFLHLIVCKVLFAEATKYSSESDKCLIGEDKLINATVCVSKLLMILRVGKRFTQLLHHE